MGYSLGIDLGTTFTAAAVRRDGRTQVVTLGDSTAEMPSVVLLRADGGVLAGSAAERRAVGEPERVAREFKRRLGDPTPVIVGGAPQPATSLLAHLLRAVVGQVVEREGAPPDAVTLTHPANWGPYKRDLFDQVPRLAELDNVSTMTEPEAAAAHYAATERVSDGAVVAVYDLGGGTFDATVLRKTADGFELLGKPEGIEALGGIDFDEAVFEHVRESLGDVTMDRGSLMRLRQECVLAKEALSADTEASIPVVLPDLQTHIRLTRAEFEGMIRPALADTLTSTRRALRSAGVEPTELTAILLVGGSSRIPLVARMVSAEFKCPTAVDAHPKHSVALGAAEHSAAALESAERGTADAPAEGAGEPAERRDPSATTEPEPELTSTNGDRSRYGADTAPLGHQLVENHVPPPLYGAGAQPPDLTPGPSGLLATLRSRRRALTVGVAVIALLLAVGGLGTTVFASPAPVVRVQPSAPVLPVVGGPSVVSNLTPTATSTATPVPLPARGPAPAAVHRTPAVPPPAAPPPPASDFCQSCEHHSSSKSSHSSAPSSSNPSSSSAPILKSSAPISKSSPSSVTNSGNN